MELLESFERDLAMRRRSARTIQSYRRNIREFLQYFPEPEKVDSDMLEEYLRCRPQILTARPIPCLV